MAQWAIEAIKGGIISVVTAGVIFVWKEGKIFVKDVNKYIKSVDEIDKLKKELAEFKSLFENEIHDIKAEYMASVHTAGEPICYLDEKRDLFYCNPAYIFLTGANEKDILGTGYEKLIAKKDLEKVIKTRNDLIRSPHSNEDTVTFKNILTGKETDTVYRTEPIRHKNGIVFKIIARFKILP